MTYWNVTAIDQYVQDRVAVVERVQRGQVIKGGVDRPISPLSEFTGQVFGVTLCELSTQNMPENLLDIEIRE